MMHRAWKKTRVVLPILSFLILGSLPHSVHARDLHGRLGLGYNAQLSASTMSNVPGVALKYGLTHDIASELIFAVATGTPSTFGIGAKFFKNIFFETNLNFYLMLGLGFSSASSLSGLDILVGPGVEFFIPGLDSVGISFEAGVMASSVTGTFVVKTMGASFLHAGMRFYF